MKKIKSQCVKVKVRLTKTNYEFSAKLGLDTNKSRSFLVVHFFNKFYRRVSQLVFNSMLESDTSLFKVSNKIITTLSLPAGIYKVLVKIRNTYKTSLSILINLILQYGQILLSRSSKEYKSLLFKNEKFVSDTKKAFAFYALAFGYFNSTRGK